MTVDPDPVLLVLGEPGIDPHASFGVDGVFSRRFYARPESGSAGLTSSSVVPDDVALLDAATGDDALREARARAPEAPIVLLHAGERLARLRAHREPDVAGRVAGEGMSWIPLELSIQIAGKETRHSPWFRGRRAAWAPAPGSSRGAPALRATRDPGDLSAILALLIRDALATAPPRHPVGAFRLLADPLFTTLRVALAGGIRDGFRGILLSALHGLHRLIVLARAWESSGIAAKGEPR